MGQAESAESEEDNCFRMCIKEKRLTTHKINALPYNNQQKPQKIIVITHTNSPKTTENKNNLPSNDNQQTDINNLQTSLQRQLVAMSAQTNCKVKKKLTKTEASTNIVQEEENQAPLVDAAAQCNNQVMLGLQSKFSSGKKAAFSTSSKGNLTKISTTYEGGTGTGTRFLSHQRDGQRQGGSSQQVVKNTKPSTNTRSRNLLLNKIQQIKQKYYERELEIEIYQDENQYQAQIDQINKIQQKYQKNRNCLPLQSIHEISAIKEKIIDKLKKRREKQNETLVNSFTVTGPQEGDKSASIHDQLELYSRDDRNVLEQSVKEPFKLSIKSSKQLKHSRRERPNLAKSNNKQDGIKSVNRSLNGSLQNQSFQDRVQFSEYSNQNTLQQIRQLDEEDEQYKSKMNGESITKRFQKDTPQTLKTAHDRIVSSKQSLMQTPSKNFTDHEKGRSVLPSVVSRMVEEQLSKHSTVVVRQKAESSNISNHQNASSGANGPPIPKSKKVLLF